MRPRTVATAFAGLAGMTVAGWVLRALDGLPAALGASVSAIAPTVSGARSYRDRQFHNTEPASTIVIRDNPAGLLSMVTALRAGRPKAAVPLAEPERPAAAGALAVTWYGHASALVEIDGYRVLTDPVWSERVSPSRLVGPSRIHPVPVDLVDLPQVDAVVISHDHYDHLDADTIATLVATQRSVFVVPLGVGAHLRHWGVPDARVIELDWGGSYSVSDPEGQRGDLTITCAEARHFSGRGLVRNTTLWAGWSLIGPEHRAYFGGDTGFTKAFAATGSQSGPYDLTLLPIGAYDPHWSDIHMNPEEAVRAHADLCQGDPARGVLIPIHWATFNLAPHPWAEPVHRLVEAAAAAGTAIAVPRPGQRLDIADLPPMRPWWEDME
ncbi:MBL fold metallo-hydrolase [Nocardia sp. NPDC024068]|uniref:MBL fold metallo-hydrolase n=1 Tax=Nocardia sp. NPDC024068 TaxID=3157197 RepID=UPI0033C2D1D8